MLNTVYKGLFNGLPCFPDPEPPFALLYALPCLYLCRNYQRPTWRVATTASTKYPCSVGYRGFIVCSLGTGIRHRRPDSWRSHDKTRFKIYSVWWAWADVYRRRNHSLNALV